MEELENNMSNQSEQQKRVRGNGVETNRVMLGGSISRKRYWSNSNKNRLPNVTNKIDEKYEHVSEKKVKSNGVTEMDKTIDLTKENQLDSDLLNQVRDYISNEVNMID